MLLRCSTWEILLPIALLNTVTGLSIDYTSWNASGVETREVYVIVYSPNDQVVTLVLLSGPPTERTTFEVLPRSLTRGLQLIVNPKETKSIGGRYYWTVPSLLPSGSDYIFLIKLGEDGGYSQPFSVRSVNATGSRSFPNPESSSSASSSATAAASTFSTGGPASSTSTNPSLPTRGQSDLTMAEKAGIGVGVSIGALLFALGAFMLGKSVRQKSKQVTITDTEGGRTGEKPELDGKAAYVEMDDESAVSACKVFELVGHLGQATATHRELDAEPQKMEIDSSDIEPLRHELHANTTANLISSPADSEDTRRMTRDTTGKSRSDAGSARPA